MAIDERSRHQLFVRLEQVLGEDHATALMEHLPPVGWADVATKRDIELLEARVDARFDRVDARFELVDARFDRLEERFDDFSAQLDAKLETRDQRLLATFRGEMIAQTRIMVFSLTAAFVGVAGIALSGGRLP